MKNFKELDFNLKDLLGDEIEDNIIFSIRFMYKKGAQNTVALVKAKVIDKLKRTYETTMEEYCYHHKLFQDINFMMEIDRKKILLKGLKLELEFWTGLGEKVLVEYTMNGLKNSELTAVNKFNLNANEKHIFTNIIESNKNKKDKKVVENKIANVFNDSVVKNNKIVAKELPGLKKHCEALVEEKNFLKAAGGKKCQVTGGKFLGGSQGKFMYSFELEDELYIYDDAPITLLIGPNKYSGNVLICEEFDIVISIDKNIGDRIGTAFISVEPWKLLEALEDKLSNQITLQNKITTSLFENGPKLATQKSIELIEKGQEKVIEHAMNEPVTIVWGPPGTGKTHTMSELAIKFMKDNKSVLIVSHSNVSVDGVAKKIFELLIEKNEHNIYKAGKVLRYGYIRDEELNNNPYISSFKYAVQKNITLNNELEELQNSHNELKHIYGIASPKLIEIHKRIGKIKVLIKEEEYKCVNKASIVATTISKIVIDKLFEDRKFDVVIFDEVSMAYVLQVVCAATYAKEHFVCVGDFMQLPPIAQSNAKTILCQDIFSYLGICSGEKPYYHPWLIMLNEQRRMHPAISKFASHYVYHDMLEDHSSVKDARKEIVDAAPFSGKPVNLINLTGTFCAAAKNVHNSR